MARPLRITYPGAFYHVTARGNERKAVFKSTGDREKFLEYLATASQRYDAVVHAYCLMNNHYHLLLQTPVANLPQIMRHINGAYTTYFNVTRTRCGHLFQGRYKLKEIGVYFGIGESAVCQAGRRVEKRMKMDRRLNKQIEALEKRINK